MNNKLINGETLADMLIAAKINLYNHKEELNDLNVFPVPDGDTGTNMSLTFGEAVKAVKNHTNTASDVLDNVSLAALRGARGNSGVILSQLLRGMARGVKGCDTLGVDEFISAFNLGTKTAYSAIMKPTEGTILTVFRMTSEHLEENKLKIKDVEQLFKEAVKAANDALEQTPEMLPKLKQAGVVDSGGKGIVYIIEGMSDYLKNQKMPKSIETNEPAEVKEQKKTLHENLTYIYCTEFIIENKKRKDNDLLNRYETLGDSIVVVADEDIIKVHIHTNEPGIIISEALKIGSLINIKIDNMQHQNDMLSENEEVSERQPYAFAAVSAGEGFTELFKELGIKYIVSGGQSMNPSSNDILNAANRSNADVVYVFPNNKNIILAAEQAAEIYDGKMVIIPTTNMSDVFSCMIGFVETDSPEDNLSSMKQIADDLKTVQVTYAVRDSVFGDIEIQKDEIICISDGAIIAKGKDINKAALAAVDKKIDEDVAVITVYSGSEINNKVADKLEQALRKKYKSVDITFIRGGQPVYYYLISME